MNTQSKHSLNNPNNDVMVKDTNFTTLINADIEKQTDKIEVRSTSATKILEELLTTIKAVDFLFLAYPNVTDVKSRIAELKIHVYNSDGSINRDDPEAYNEYRDLNKELNSYRLTNNHYLILVVEHLLETAKDNNWGLAKRNDFVYVYNEEYWISIDKEELKHFLGQVALKMGVEKFKGKIHTFRDDLYKQFMSEAYLPTPETDNKRILINLLNGTFEISPSRRRLREFKRSDFITHQLPFQYDALATAPMFQRFLDEVIPDKSKQKVLAEYLGYIFIKSSVLKLEKTLILYGTGANGKSVVFEIIEALLGVENMSNYSLSNLTDKNGYYRAMIGDKLVNYASEIGRDLDNAYFKQLTSGEPIDARLPYGNPMRITEYAKLIFNSNELPHATEHNNAYFRRFLIIHFDVTIPESKQDKDLSNKIVKSELSGIFNWILEGVERLLKQRKFSHSEAIENATNTYKNESDTAKLFLDEYEYKVSENHTPIRSLYSDYTTFCISGGYKPVNRSNFVKRLKHHGIFVKRMSVGYVAYVESDLNAF